jgi:hypothetical protein
MNQLFLEKHVEREALLKELQDVLGEENINIYSSVDHSFSHKDFAGYFLVLTELPGEFPLSVEIYPETNKTDEEICIYLSRCFNCQVLFADKSNNPYSWNVLKNQRIGNVQVDPEFLDKKNGFRVCA